MSNDRKIDYIELPARDLDAVARFYTEAFGWNFTDYGPDYRAFTDGALDGGFYRAEAASSTANGAALVILYAEDLERARRTVLDSGGSIVKEIFAREKMDVNIQYLEPGPGLRFGQADACDLRRAEGRAR